MRKTLLIQVDHLFKKKLPLGIKDESNLKLILRVISFRDLRVVMLFVFPFDTIYGAIIMPNFVNKDSLT